MEFLGTYFLWFLATAVVAAVVAIVLQLRNMKNFHKDFLKGPSESGEGDPFSSMVGKFLPVALAALTAGVSFILFVVGIIVNLINQTP